MGIVEQWAKNRVVENIIERHYAFNMDNPYINDLIQDIYISLLGCDDSIIQALEDSGDYKHYIRRMISNNIFSKTSPYYYKYQKFRKITDNIDDLKDGV